MSAVRLVPSVRQFSCAPFSKAARAGFTALGALLAAGLWSGAAAQGAAIAWRGSLAEATRESAQQNRPMLVMVSNRGCGPCHKMLRESFTNVGIAARVNSQFVPVLLDSGVQGDQVASLSVDATPTVLVISPSRKVIGRYVGYQTAAQLNSRLAAFGPAMAARAVPQRPAMPRPALKSPLYARGSQVPPRPAPGLLRPAARGERRMSFYEARMRELRGAARSTAAPVSTVKAAEEFSRADATPAPSGDLGD